jgi:hypothetical protein
MICDAIVDRQVKVKLLVVLKGILWSFDWCLVGHVCVCVCVCVEVVFAWPDR